MDLSSASRRAISMLKISREDSQCLVNTWIRLMEVLCTTWFQRFLRDGEREPVAGSNLTCELVLGTNLSCNKPQWELIGYIFRYILDEQRNIH